MNRERLFAQIDEISRLLVQVARSLNSIESNVTRLKYLAETTARELRGEEENSQPVAAEASCDSDELEEGTPRPLIHTKDDEPESEVSIPVRVSSRSDGSSGFLLFTRADGDEFELHANQLTGPREELADIALRLRSWLRGYQNVKPGT